MKKLASSFLCFDMNFGFVVSILISYSQTCFPWTDVGDDIQRIKSHAQQTDSDWDIFRGLATRLANEQKISPRVLFLEAHRKVTSSADHAGILVRDNSARSSLLCIFEF